ncbi:metallophosphoesterase [uncultured Jatrophihabitans sp.]|uniref:metallophosphoesterase n=1 Tax=uncultured Jatrophihabitans sp. TaxID=1610747 RepID=UPI0035CB72CD
MSARVAVIGDLAGHLNELTGELRRLGADPRTGRLPDDLRVVQVGDLVHRGPEPEGVVALVDRYLREQPQQWVQLAGNHEAQYLREPAFSWPERIADTAVDTLRRWWSTGRMRVATTIRTPDEDFLITHAGVTEGFWRLALDSPPRADQAAAAINSFIGRHDDVLFHAGQMLGGGDPDPGAGPLWAAAATELAPGWLSATAPTPFSQVHGHSGVVDWRRRTLNCSPHVAEHLTVDLDSAHESIAVPGGRLVGVDPGHARRPHHPWRAFVLDDATIR